MGDLFRPTAEPARTIYDAFQAEAKHRSSRPDMSWVEAEREAVWRAARDYAQKHGLPVLTMSDIERAENLALGHIDYGKKWALGVAERLLQDTERKTNA